MQITIRELEKEDIKTLEPILREHIKNRDTGEIVDEEIEAIKGYMQGKVDEENRKRKYYVATIEKQIVGCMAYSTPDKDMIEYFGPKYKNSAELLNAFVSTKHMKGKGIGKSLLNKICEETEKEGYEYLLINSGPRYKNSWGFYDKTFDSDNGMITEKYGSGGDAKTWYKKLKKEKYE